MCEFWHLAGAQPPHRTELGWGGGMLYTVSIPKDTANAILLTLRSKEKYLGMAHQGSKNCDKRWKKA